MNESKVGIKVKTETSATNLAMLDQQLALGAYLQALLRPPETTEAVTEPVPATPVEVPVVPAEAAEAVMAPAVVVEPVLAAQEPVVEATAADTNLPDWAEGNFQCLLFKVAGLALALPLARLNGVLPWDSEAVTEMPNHQPWFLGLREHLGHKVKLIDVANVVLPPDRCASLAAPDSGRLGKVILIGDGQWGLACDDVGEVVTLSVDAVKWRTKRGGRPWLAGTVIKEMCALIDTDTFAQMLGSSGPDRS